MTLSFSTHFPNGTPTHFVEKILAPFILQYCLDFPPKIHTFRKGYRWKPGMTMHMVTADLGKVRVLFNKGIPALEFCAGEQPTVIGMWHTGQMYIHIYDEPGENIIKALTPADMLIYAANDGFNSLQEMEDWFFPKGFQGRPHPSHVGQTVHFTPFKY